MGLIGVGFKLLNFFNLCITLILPFLGAPSHADDRLDGLAVNFPFPNPLRELENLRRGFRWCYSPSRSPHGLPGRNDTVVTHVKPTPFQPRQSELRDGSSPLPLRYSRKRYAPTATAPSSFAHSS